MLPPNNMAIRHLSQEEGISGATSHKWRAEARGKGQLLLDAKAGPAGWSSRDKFAVVLESAAMNEADLAEYCRKRGLFPEQIKAWRGACEQANDWARIGIGTSTAKMSQVTREDRKRVKDLERELARKDRALAETAALLVLRKKLGAIWGDEKRSGASQIIMPMSGLCRCGVSSHCFCLVSLRRGRHNQRASRKARSLSVGR